MIDKKMKDDKLNYHSNKVKILSKDEIQKLRLDKIRASKIIKNLLQNKNLTN